MACGNNALWGLSLVKKCPFGLTGRDTLLSKRYSRPVVLNLLSSRHTKVQKRFGGTLIPKKIVKLTKRMGKKFGGTLRRSLRHTSVPRLRNTALNSKIMNVLSSQERLARQRCLNNTFKHTHTHTLLHSHIHTFTKDRLKRRQQKIFKAKSD